MAFGLKKFSFKGGARSPSSQPEDIRLGLAAWRAGPAPALDGPHFHTRYVIIDVATSGPRANDDELQGISAVGLKDGSITPDDAFALEFSADDADPVAVDRRLMAFLTYAAKAALVTYHGPFVSGFLQRAFKERLGVSFQPPWIDLAWLLPSLFPEKSQLPLPLDDWLGIFGIDGGGRRDAMANALVLARLFQILLVRANEKDILSASKLIEESQSASFLRRNH